MKADEVRRLLSTPTNIPTPWGLGLKAHHRELFRIDYLTDSVAADLLLPEPLQMTDPPTASILFTRFVDIFGDESYVEVSHCLAARFGETPGLYVISVHTDNLSSLLLNRELYIQPIVWGEGTLEHVRGLTRGALDLEGERVVTATALFRNEEISESEALATGAETKFFLKILGSPLLLEKPRPTLFQLTPEVVEISAANQSVATLELRPHVLAPLSDLPVQQVIRAVTLSMKLTPGSLRAIHRYA